MGYAKYAEDGIKMLENEHYRRNDDGYSMVVQKKRKVAIKRSPMSQPRKKVMNKINNARSITRKSGNHAELIKKPAENVAILIIECKKRKVNKRLVSAIEDIKSLGFRDLTIAQTERCIKYIFTIHDAYHI